MARIGGRSLWLAWPAGLLCAAAVGGLIVLAMPGVPVAVSFVGETLRAASTVPSDTGEPPPPPASDCRHLYSQPLWSSLVWSPGALLSQRHTAAASTPEAVAAAGATVVVTCHWRGEGDRSLETTVSTVSDQGSAAVQTTLAGQGFACATEADTVHCERDAGGVVEIHDLRADRWVSSTLVDWQPRDYAAIVASHAFFGE